MTSPTPSPLAAELVPIDELRPDPANPRRIGDDELDALERSLRQYGFVQPVLARREDRTVIGGHQRLVAARRLGLATVPVTWLDISTEQARLLGLALNNDQPMVPVVAVLEVHQHNPSDVVANSLAEQLPDAHQRCAYVARVDDRHPLGCNV